MSKLTVLAVVCCGLMIAAGCEEAEPIIEAAPLKEVDLSSLSDRLQSVERSAGPSSRFVVGESFPLLKSVTQSLIHETPRGIDRSESRLDLFVTLTVDRVDPVGTWLTASYRKVRYSLNIADTLVEYDSDFDGAIAPAEVRPYAAMVGNSFQFQLSPSNKVAAVSGLQTFMHNCIQSLPEEQQQPMLSVWRAQTGHNGVASFVDETIGMLPFDGGKLAITAGDSWNRERTKGHPAPIRLKSLNRVVSSSGQTVTVAVTGTINTESNRPASAVSAPYVTNGQTIGQSVFDRRTGLPLQSRMDTSLDLAITNPDGTSSRQHKQIVSSIQSLDDVVTRVAEDSRSQNVQPASLQLDLP